MATESESNHGFLYFIVGVLLVGVVVLGIMFFNGGFGARNEGPMERAAEAVGQAADEVGDAARNNNPAPGGG
jgi:hypothetical protein